jgi:hypothetical protein
LILFFDWIHDQYELWMTNVQLVCGIDWAFFNIGADKPVGFSSPITSGTTNPPIGPGQSVEYGCDPTNYMKLENGKLSLLGMTTENPLNSPSKFELANTQVWIGVIYRTMWMLPQREFIGNKWKFEAGNPNWQEVLPVYR